jgi:protein ImuA
MFYMPLMATALDLSTGLCAQRSTLAIDAGPFEAVREKASRAPLTEIVPDSSNGAAASTGFAIAWTLQALGNGLLVWACPEGMWREHGAPYAEGLYHMGLGLDQVLFVRTRTQADALWTAEQALAVPGAVALCSVAPAKKTLSLIATRRLLLFGERNATRCVLLRFDGANASAAWTRWRVTPAPSTGEDRELGPPRFSVRLERNRAGPSGASYLLEWIAHERRFEPGDSRSHTGTMDGGMVAALGHGTLEPYRRRSG